MSDSGVSGPIIRASSIYFDLRFAYNSTYRFLNLKSIKSQTSDNLSRILIRVEEIQASLNIALSVLNLINPYIVSSKLINPISTMESTIAKFITVPESSTIVLNRFYLSIESGKGLLCSIVSGESLKRLKIRTPGLYNLQMVLLYSQSIIIPDLLATIASIDLIMGEVDR